MQVRQRDWEKKKELLDKSLRQSQGTDSLTKISYGYMEIFPSDVRIFSYRESCSPPFRWIICYNESPIHLLRTEYLLNLTITIYINFLTHLSYYPYYRSDFSLFSSSLFFGGVFFCWGYDRLDYVVLTQKKKKKTGTPPPQPTIPLFFLLKRKKICPCWSDPNPFLGYIQKQGEIQKNLDPRFFALQPFFFVWGEFYHDRMLGGGASIDLSQLSY